MMLFLAGMTLGIVMMALVSAQDHRAMTKKTEEVIGSLQDVVDELERELHVKQNIIDSMNVRITRQRRIIEREKGVRR